MTGGLLGFSTSWHWRDFQVGSRNKTYTIPFFKARVSR
jgi:hypothetical protein